MALLRSVAAQSTPPRSDSSCLHMGLSGVGRRQVSRQASRKLLSAQLKRPVCSRSVSHHALPAARATPLPGCRVLSKLRRHRCFGGPLSWTMQLWLLVGCAIGSASARQLMLSRRGSTLEMRGRPRLQRAKSCTRLLSALATDSTRRRSLPLLRPSLLLRKRPRPCLWLPHRY